MSWLLLSSWQYSRWETLGQVGHGKSEAWIYSPWKPVCPKVLWGPPIVGSWLRLGCKMIKEFLKISSQHTNIEDFQIRNLVFRFFLKNQKIRQHWASIPMWRLWPELSGGCSLDSPPPSVGQQPLSHSLWSLWYQGPGSAAIYCGGWDVLAFWK